MERFPEQRIPTGKEQRSFYGGWTCESYHNYGSVIFCTGSSFEYEFLRIVRRKHSCINTRVLFFHSKGVYVSKKKIWKRKKRKIFQRENICKTKEKDIKASVSWD